MKNIIKINTALESLAAGKMIILADDLGRENEGDIVFPAEKITPEIINFMATHARGIICLTLSEEITDRLELSFMSTRHKNTHQARFMTSIEAVNGVSTGVSAFDRAHTILVAVKPQSSPEDIAMPGHVFPLQACKGGVLARPGHTEGSVDLMRLANLTQAAVICEIMNDDGTMANLSDLEIYAHKHNLGILCMSDLIAYRKMQANHQN
jgi:3,4-dihydroxy 2-butanone 4-phosphate synthase/GTP cyclohydrolase II